MWAVADTIEDLKSTLGSEDFANCIVYSIEPPCPAWVDGMGSIMTHKADGEKEFSKVFPVMDLRKRATKKNATSTKELFERALHKTDSGKSQVNTD